MPPFAKKHARASDVCDFSRRTSSTTSLLPLPEVAEAAMRSSSAALEVTSIRAPPSASPESVPPSAAVARTRPSRGVMERWVPERRCGGCLSDAGATSDEWKSMVVGTLLAGGRCAALRGGKCQRVLLHGRGVVAWLS